MPLAQQIVNRTNDPLEADMPEPLRYALVGAAAGLALFALGGWAFVRGCPVFDVETLDHF
ncbi:hypothetical protein A5718_29690 [Mycolicibacterium conceptionense]|nr:hypothetical protein A5718_29690 [Mycolicibacterium conceptionense]